MLFFRLRRHKDENRRKHRSAATDCQRMARRNLPECDLVVRVRKTGFPDTRRSGSGAVAALVR
jgi:hypothetical protein